MRQIGFRKEKKNNKILSIAFELFSNCFFLNIFCNDIGILKNNGLINLCTDATLESYLSSGRTLWTHSKYPSFVQVFGKFHYIQCASDTIRLNTGVHID